MKTDLILKFNLFSKVIWSSTFKTTVYIKWFQNCYKIIETIIIYIFCETWQHFTQFYNNNKHVNISEMTRHLNVCSCYLYDGYIPYIFLISLPRWFAVRLLLCEQEMTIKMSHDKVSSKFQSFMYKINSILYSTVTIYPR